MKSTERKSKTIKCAFCKGRGLDPFGIMSEMATCQVCGGKKAVEVFEPFVDCRFCKGSGVYPTQRLSCTACSGKGVISQETKNGKLCESCNGTGVCSTRGAGFWCVECHGSGLAIRGMI